MITQRQLLKLTLPKLIGIGNIAALFGICSQIKASTSDIELDCAQVRHFDPLGMTVLVSALEFITQSHRVSMLWLSVNIAQYLERMDFFARLKNIEGVEIPQGRARHDQAHSLMEITLLRSSDNAEEVTDRLANAVVGSMVGRAAKPIDFLALPDTEFLQYYHPIRYSLSELVGNALTHARREGHFDASVWIASQYYKDDGGKVHLAVVDDGCGFLATLKHHAQVREQTHAAAIEAALKPRVSCNRDLGIVSTSENQGVGLTTTVLIAKKSGGSVHIVSGDTLYRDGSLGLRKRSDRVKALPGAWNGVAISAVLNRDQLPLIRIADLLPKDEVDLTFEAPEIDFRFSE